MVGGWHASIAFFETRPFLVHAMYGLARVCVFVLFTIKIFPMYSVVPFNVRTAAGSSYVWASCIYAFFVIHDKFYHLSVFCQLFKPWTDGGWQVLTAVAIFLLL